MRSDLVGLRLTEVSEDAKAQGHVVQILGEDGVCLEEQTDVFNGKRVNVVVENGRVVWANMS